MLECAKRCNHHVLDVLKVNNKRLYIYGIIKVLRDIILKRFKIVQLKFFQKVVRKLFYNFKYLISFCNMKYNCAFSKQLVNAVTAF